MLRGNAIVEEVSVLNQITTWKLSGGDVVFYFFLA